MAVFFFCLGTESTFLTASRKRSNASVASIMSAVPVFIKFLMDTQPIGHTDLEQKLNEAHLTCRWTFVAFYEPIESPLGIQPLGVRFSAGPNSAVSAEVLMDSGDFKSPIAVGYHL